MFKLELTDGYKNIQAMEIKQISCLNTKLAPGIKMLFIGPIQVVNHIMMIKPENVRVVGGELEELLVINAYENVLLRLLNRPTTENPIKNYEEPSVENEKSSYSRPQNIIEMKEQKYKPQNVAIATNNLMDDDEDFDLAMIEAIEKQEMQKSQEINATTNLPTETALDDDIDDYILAQIDLEEDLIRNRGSINSRENHESNHVSFTNNIAGKRRSTESPAKIVPPTKAIKLSPVRKPTIIDNDYPFKIDNRYNFLTIDQYVGLQMSSKIELEYAIEAFVERVFKIRATDNGWLLLVQIKDCYSSNKLSVRFSDEIVAEFGKRSASEVLLLRKRMQDGQSQLKMDIEGTLERINRSIQDGPFLLCIKMKVTLPADYENVVTRLLTRNETNKRIVTSKIVAENILLA